MSSIKEKKLKYLKDCQKQKLSKCSLSGRDRYNIRNRQWKKFELFMHKKIKSLRKDIAKYEIKAFGPHRCF